MDLQTKYRMGQLINAVLYALFLIELLVVANQTVDLAYGLGWRAGAAKADPCAVQPATE